MVGGVGQIDYTAFDGFDYVALGHIHAAYAVGRESIRYAGSPLCYHFNETRQSAKGPVLVELGAKGEGVKIETLAIPPLHPMREIRGAYEEIREAELNDPRRGEYLRIVLTDRRVSPESSAFFRELYAGRDSVLMELCSEFTRFSGEAAALGDAEALRQAVHEAGVHPGIPRGLDPGALEQALLAGTGGYSYVGAHLRGVRLVIEAVPEVPAPPVYDLAAARDLVADRDGIVLAANVQSGVSCVEPGDAVRRGQLLIRGEEQASAEATRPIAALGEVIVRTWFTGEASMPLVERVARPTGRESASASLKTPWFELPITVGTAFSDSASEAELLPIGGLFVPVGIERVTSRELSLCEVARDMDWLKQALAPLAMADAAAKLTSGGPGEYEILSRWIDYERAGDRLTARAVIEIRANAAVTRESLTRHD